MPLDSKHPHWTAHAPDWEVVADISLGQRAIKEKTTQYLPPTGGMISDGLQIGQQGHAAYSAYLMRAVFPTDFNDAIEAIVGIMHRKPAVITVPKVMEPMLERLSVMGEDAHGLLRRMNEEQFRKGRIGLLLDVPDNLPIAESRPYVATYDARAVINWTTSKADGGPERVQLVVLDETDWEQRAGLDWERVEKYRVLALRSVAERMGFVGTTPDAVRAARVVAAQVARDQYIQARVVASREIAGAQWIAPSVGGRGLEEIPFVFCNSTDLVPSPQPPPLMGLADICLTIYRGEADYRQNIFMQGQDTLVTIGELIEGAPDPLNPASSGRTRLGAGAKIALEAGGDAKFIGVSADALGEMRQSLENDYSKASARGLRLLDMADGGSAESGDALRIRVAARTASAVQVARTGAAALEQILRYGAIMVGARPEEVEVKPNLDFAENPMTGKELSEWMAARNLGAPIALSTIHEIMTRREATTKSFEEEMDEREAEADLPGVQQQQDPNAVEEELPPEDDETDEEDL